ncbi:MAG: pentapeptide repeat-containing protein [Hyphomonadaceae bacterium]|nr:pentapeptide repeat-containing protein [Hyphomonadaceae bacterium]
MVNFKLLVNAKAEVCLVHDERFPVRAREVRYDPRSRLAFIHFDNGSTLEVAWEINDTLHHHLTKNDHCNIVLQQGKKAIEGYSVPLLVGQSISDPADAEGVSPIAASTPPSKARRQAASPAKAPPRKINMLVNAKGKVCIVYDQRFPVQATYARYDRHARKVWLGFADGSTLEMVRRVPDNLHPFLIGADTCMSILIENRKPSEGSELPLLVGSSSNERGDRPPGAVDVAPAPAWARDLHIAVIANEAGKACVLHDKRFPSQVVHVRYDPSSRRLVIGFEDGTRLEKAFDVPDDAHARLLTADVCSVIFMENKEAVDGVEAPLLKGYTAQLGSEDDDPYASWRAADFSWEGLTKKEWIGWRVLDDGRLAQVNTLTPHERATARRATLQDYWRDEENDLIEGDGMRWARVHCPLAWRDGTPTPKAGWTAEEHAAFEALISAKLAAAGESGIWLSGETADLRAQLQGAVLLKTPTLPEGSPNPLSARFDRAVFIESVSWVRGNFSIGVTFTSAMFCKNASFTNVTFTKDVSFASAVFLGGATFYDVVIKGDANFGSTNFARGARFDNAVIEGKADFSFTAFGGEAAFVSAKFNQNARFAFATFAGRAAFAAAHFHAIADWASARFRMEADFRDATFEKPAYFNSANFSGVLHMAGAIFRSPAGFREAKFGGRMDFRAAVFEAAASFESIAWPTLAGDWHGAFQQARFRAAPSFAGSRFKALAAFAGAALENGLAIDDEGEAAASRTFVQERRAAIAAAARDAQDWAAEEIDKNGGRMNRSLIAKKRFAARETRLKQLESGCRVLKQAMAQASNKPYENMLYRFELQARRAQRDTPLWEKTLSHLYGLASNYGASMTRPFLALGVLLVVFAAHFYALGVIHGLVGESITRDAWQAWDFSFANVFRPLSSLSGSDFERGTLAHRLLTIDTPGWTSAVRALSTLQSLLAIVLAFLFALAVRRRFQIN